MSPIPALVQVFARAPCPGRAKTRLVPVLGTERAARLQRWLVDRVVATAAAAFPGAVELWSHPGVGDGFLAAAAARYGCTEHAQCGADLGEAMATALAAGLRRAPGVVLVGSDCPGIASADLAAAAAALARGADCVLGPALDGGYYLVGVRRELPEIFAGVDWGTGRVLEQTRSRLVGLGCRWAELRVLRDLDEPADLDQLGPLWFAG